MPYPRKNLNEYETVALDLHPHWWYFSQPVAALVGGIILALVSLIFLDGDLQTAVNWVAIAVIVLSIIWTGVRYIRWKNTNFVITSDRIIFRSGVVSKHSIDIPLESVNNVLSSQSVFERMLGLGDILIESAGETGQQRFTDVKRPEQVKNIIHSQREENDARRWQGGGNAGDDVTVHLERLEGLRERGTLTEEEFEAQKRRLLGDA